MLLQYLGLTRLYIFSKHYIFFYVKVHSIRIRILDPYEPLENFLKSYDDLDFLPFNNLTKFDNRNQRNLMEYNQNPRILMCQFSEGKPVDVMIPKECQVFHLSMTNAGIGYTFNNANFWNIFAKTNYTTMFAKLMRPKGFDLDLEGKIEDEESVYPKNIIFPKNSGPFYGLKVSITLF